MMEDYASQRNQGVITKKGLGKNAKPVAVRSLSATASANCPFVSIYSSPVASQMEPKRPVVFTK